MDKQANQVSSVFNDLLYSLEHVDVGGGTLRFVREEIPTAPTLAVLRVRRGLAEAVCMGRELAPSHTYLLIPCPWI